MIWAIEFDERARRELRQLDNAAQARILTYLRQRIATEYSPGRFGAPLKGRLAGLWRYRVDHYRMVCRIEDEKLAVLVVRIGHRREVYER